MEIREFAERVVFSENLDEKLAPPNSTLTDSTPGPEVRPSAPGRPANLQFAARRTAPAMPRAAAFHDPLKRGIAHHIMANHELQAVEVMGFVLLAFPDAPAEFRMGLAHIVQDEQRHTKLHARRATELGVEFGSKPVNCYIWKKALDYRSLLDYVVGLPLTFEGRNLDHTVEFEEYFRDAGDERGAAILRAIHHDEIQHVAFGVEWLKRLKNPDQSEWDAFCAHLHWPMRPEKARGEVFLPEPRRAAGMSDDFILRLSTVAADDNVPGRKA
ncbi:MAG: DUF455 family protein [Planctomycetaceae bacterium]